MPPRAFDIGMWEDETEETETSTGFTEPYHVQEASKGLMFKEPIKVFLKPSEAKFRSVSKEVLGWSLEACSFETLGAHAHIILNDSMAPLLALLKGRSSSAPLQRACRQVAALALCCGCGVVWRW
eukprot:3811628-Pyramimonas_sp.AAC.1